MGVYFGAGTGVLRFDGTQKITGVPMTFSAWVFTAEGGASAGGRVVYLGSSSGDFQYFTMGLTNGLAGLANCRNTSGGLVNVLTTNIARPGAWNHIAATAAAAGASSVRVILNGDFSGAGVGAGENVAGIDRFSLGVTDRATPLAYWEGGLALVAGWNVVLPDTSIHALNAGADPRAIRPDALRYLYPLHFGPNEDCVGPGPLAYVGGGAAPFGDPFPPPFRRRGRALLGALVDAATTFAVDSLGTLVETVALPLSFATLILADASSRPDWLAALDGGHRLALDWPASVAADRGARVAWLATGGAAAGAPVEWGGAILVAMDAAAPVEMLATLAREEPARIAFAGAVAMDARVPFATGRLVGADAGAAIDWLRSVGIDAATHPEWSVGLVINADTLAPVEWDGQAAFVADARLFIVERRSVVFQVEARSVVFRIEKQ